MYAKPFHEFDDTSLKIFASKSHAIGHAFLSHCSLIGP